MAGADGGGDGPGAAPQPLPAPALDSHCHLDMIERPVAEVLADARAAGIIRVVTIGTDLASSRWAARLRRTRTTTSTRRWPSTRTRPSRPARRRGAPARGSARREVLAQIAALAALARVRAIGETGLDYYRDYAEPGGAAGLVPRAHRDRQAGRQGAGDPRPGRARGRAAHPGRARARRSR